MIQAIGHAVDSRVISRAGVSCNNNALESEGGRVVEVKVKL